MPNTTKSKDKSSEQRFGHVNATNCNSYFNIIFIIPLPHRVEALSDTFVWRLLRTSCVTREQRGLGRLKLAQR